VGGPAAEPLLTADAFDNAITVDMAIGGSTNAIVHLVAMAGRVGVKLPLERFDQISQRTPTVANLRPSGEFLMEDFYDAGGIRALLNRIRHLLHVDCPTANGKTLGENVADAEVIDPRVILPVDQPLSRAGATFVLRGNLAPDGCVIKPTAAEPRLLRHTGPAVVFENYADLKARIDDEALDVTPDSVIVLKSGGPVGAPSMPEWGMLPIPKKLLKQGVRDMVRISDARMSGTSYGTCVLHVSPESAVGGPLALVRTGDRIELDVYARRSTCTWPTTSWPAGGPEWTPPPKKFTRGYGALFCGETTQAHEGCDFKFLHADGGGRPSRTSTNPLLTSLLVRCGYLVREPRICVYRPTRHGMIRRRTGRRSAARRGGSPSVRARPRVWVLLQG
jgi:dihydroxy-acid dehydratase